MNYELLSLRTSDEVEVRYPRNFLARTCDLILDALEHFDGEIRIPFSSQDLNLFFKMLETRKALESTDKTLRALEVADYFQFELNPQELHKMVSDLDLDNENQIDEFLKSAGFKEMSISSLIHLLTHLTELQQFTGLTVKERFARVKQEIISKEELTFLEVYDLSFPLVPQIFRSRWIVLRELFPKDKKIEKNHLSYLKTAVGLVENFYFKEEEEVAVQQMPNEEEEELVLPRIDPDLIARLIAQQRPNL